MRSAVQAQIDALVHLNITPDVLSQLKAWTEQKQAVTLRFKAKETCVFDREQTREVESSTGVLHSIIAKITSKVVQKITEYVYVFAYSYEISAYPGSDPEHALQLWHGHGRAEV